MWLSTTLLALALLGYLLHPPASRFAVHRPPEASPPLDSIRMANFERFLGPWEFPPAAVERTPQLAEFYARHDTWGPRRRTVRLRETVHKQNPDRLVFEGFAYWHPVEDKIRFTGYNVQARFYFEGEYQMLQPRRIVREYAVYYPADFSFTEYPEVKGSVRRYRGEWQLTDDSTMTMTTRMLVGSEWVIWPTADAKPFTTRRAR
jgi:hypothetical protein